MQVVRGSELTTCDAPVTHPSMSSSTPGFLKVLNIVSAVMFIITMGMAFLYAPREVTMGEVQRVFYMHVSTAWVGMVALFIGLVAGVALLMTGNMKWDRLGLATVELGVVFSLAALATGMIWGRPAWNTWWTWDPRTTTFAIMLLIYFAYLMLRNSFEDPARRARFAAVYAIVGFISVPITFFSIRLWRTIHPVVVGSGDPTADGSFNMVAPMVHTLLFSITFFTVLYITLLWHRLRLAEAVDRVEELKIKALTA
jgi:heme exporter protein C